VKEEALIGETEQVRGFRRDALFQTAPVAEVSIQVGGMTLKRRAAVLDGEVLGWEGAISFAGHRREERDQLIELWEFRSQLSENQTKYLPPKIVGGKVKEAVPWETVVGEDSLVKKGSDEANLGPETSGKQPGEEKEITAEPDNPVREITVEERDGEVTETAEVEPEGLGQDQEEELGLADVVQVPEQPGTN